MRENHVITYSWVLLIGSMLMTVTEKIFNALSNHSQLITACATWSVRNIVYLSYEFCIEFLLHSKCHQNGIRFYFQSDWKWLLIFFQRLFWDLTILRETCFWQKCMLLFLNGIKNGWRLDWRWTYYSQVSEYDTFMFMNIN